MAAVYVYGFARVGFRPQPGVDTIEHGELVALASAVQTPVRMKRRDLLRHSEVTQQAFARGTVLPTRFGTVFDSESSVVDDVLAPRHDELVELLRRFDGLGELRVVAEYDETSILEEIVRANAGISRLAAETASTGPDDPRRIRLGQAVADALTARKGLDADAIVRALVPLACDAELEEPQGELEVVRGSFLIGLEQAQSFDLRLEEIARLHEGRIHLKCTGPLPPHSFVSLAGVA